MSPSEYEELVDFLGGKFEQIDRRFEQIDRRFERLEDEVRHVRVELEQNRHLIKLNAEAILSVDRKLETFRQEFDRRLDRLEAA